VQSDIASFRRQYPELMTAETPEKSYKARVAADKERINGLRFSKQLTPKLMEEFFNE